MESLVLELERLSFDAWRARVIEDLGGWRLRFHFGVTGRANSVWPNAWEGSFSAAERIVCVEEFYARHGRPAMYQLSPAARPGTLDDLLAERGYALAAPVWVQTAPIDRVLAGGEARADASVEVSETLSEDWFEVAGHRGRWSGEQIPAYRELLGRALGTTGFAVARRNGRAAAVGLGVARSGWIGIFSMLTLPEHRGLGVAEAVLRSLALWGRERRCARMYLQVEKENVVAQTLYGQAGFEPLYSYHYRVAPAVTPR